MSWKENGSKSEDKLFKPMALKIRIEAMERAVVEEFPRARENDYSLPRISRTFLLIPHGQLSWDSSSLMGVMALGE